MKIPLERNYYVTFYNDRKHDKLFRCFGNVSVCQKGITLQYKRN